MTLVLDRTAPTDAPILDVFAERWSTRLFDAVTPLDEDALHSALEAARWSPSASNTQPWRFAVARRGTATHAKVMETLIGFNQAWAGAAAALVVMVAETADEDGNARVWSAYDLGQAAAYFTAQAHADGLYTHAMGGFDRAALAAALGLDERFVPETVIAVGTLGDIAGASEELQARELAPRVRRTVAESTIVND